MTGLTSLTTLGGLVLKVTYLTDSSLAIEADDTNLTGGKSYLSSAVLLSHELSECTCGTNELCALAGVKLNVVDNGTYGNCRDRKNVTGLDICIRASGYDVTVGKALGSDDVALLALLVLKECDVRGSVGVVLDTENLCGLVCISLEVDNSVLLLVSAAVMTNGDLAVAVTAGMLLLLYDEALLGAKLGNLVEGGADHISTRRSSRLVSHCCHLYFSSCLSSCSRRMR